MTRKVLCGKAAIEYELVLTARKSIECRVRPGCVTVFAPKGCPVKEADAYVLRQAEWIFSALRRTGERAEAAQERTAAAMQEGALIPVEGEELPLSLLAAPRTSVSREQGKLVVRLPDRDPLRVRAAVRDYLISLAKTRLEERVKHYAAQIGVRPNRVTLREQKTKWGSCSSLGNLNFNWKLIMAPPQALDYVVVHELCHMIELNHSSAFWALVEKHMPGYRTWQTYLKNSFRSPF